MPKSRHRHPSHEHRLTNYYTDGCLPTNVLCQAHHPPDPSLGTWGGGCDARAIDISLNRYLLAVLNRIVPLNKD